MLEKDHVKGTEMPQPVTQHQGPKPMNESILDPSTASAELPQSTPKDREMSCLHSTQAKFLTYRIESDKMVILRL